MKIPAVWANILIRTGFILVLIDLAFCRYIICLVWERKQGILSYYSSGLKSRSIYSRIFSYWMNYTSE